MGKYYLTCNTYKLKLFTIFSKTKLNKFDFFFCYFCSMFCFVVISLLVNMLLRYVKNKVSKNSYDFQVGINLHLISTLQHFKVFPLSTTKYIDLLTTLQYCCVLE